MSAMNTITRMADSLTEQLLQLAQLLGQLGYKGYIGDDTFPLWYHPTPHATDIHIHANTSPLQRLVTQSQLDSIPIHTTHPEDSGEQALRSVHMVFPWLPTVSSVRRIPHSTILVYNPNSAQYPPSIFIRNAPESAIQWFTGTNEEQEENQQTHYTIVRNTSIYNQQVRSPWIGSTLHHVRFEDDTQQQQFTTCTLHTCTFHSIHNSTFTNDDMNRITIVGDVEFVTFSGNKCTNVNLSGVTRFDNNMCTNNRFSDTLWGKTPPLEVATTSFTTCTFENNDLCRVVFKPYHSLQQCVFEGGILRADQLRTCILRQARLSHVRSQHDEPWNFSQCDMYESTVAGLTHFDEYSFVNANAIGAQFTECVFSFPNIFQRCAVQNVTFDRCDVRNVNFNGCDLTGCDFTGSNQLGMRIERATLRSVRGVWTLAQRFPELVAQRAMANQVHAFSRRIQWTQLNQWLKQHTATPVAGPSSSQSIPRWFQQQVSGMIDRSGEPEWKVLLTDIIHRRLQRADWNEFSPVVVQTAIHAVQYTLEQPNAFQRGYAEGFVKDTTNAYDGNDVQSRMSCVYGAVERLTISLLNGVTSARTDAAVTNDDPYDPLVRMIHPPMMEQLVKEWYLLHENSGDHAFRTDGSKEEREASLREYVAQHGGSAEELNRMILGLTFDDDDFNRHLEQIIRNWYRFHNNQRQHAFPAETTEDEKRDSLRAYVQQEYPAGRQQLETVLQTGAWRFGPTLFDAVVQGGRGRGRSRGKGRGRSRGRGGRGRSRGRGRVRKTRWILSS